jgi:anti-sigma regulatory factor (Ser/Thr protein kinase)
MNRGLDASRSIDLQLPAVPRSVTAARHELADYLRAAGVTSWDAELAITEAVANAVEHAFRDRNGGTIYLRFETLVPDTLAVTVADDGIGFAPDPDHDGLGLGLSLIGRLASEVAVSEREPYGAAVTMHFHVRQSGPPNR